MADFAINDTDTDCDSDEELQDAFAKGLLKPGLNKVVEKSIKTYVNNIDDMKLKHKEFKLKGPWIETLDLITTVAPMAPDVVLQIQETAIRRKNIKENSKSKHAYDSNEDPVLNEFKRENVIHRQAQAAVVEGLRRLKKFGIPTIRPDDYFAEMAKTDEHMQKVRKNLLAKQAGQARAEKVRQLRQQKKIGKQLQIDARLKQAAEKRQMLEQLKRVRKGQSSDLDFLNNKGGNRSDYQNNKNSISKKRLMKNKKFGFGGKKKGSKLNTRESSSQVNDFNRSTKVKKNHPNFKEKGNFKNGPLRKKMKVNKKQRLGKSKRKNTKR